MRLFLKFITGGIFNTLITYILYLVLLNIFPYSISYTVSYATGIVFSYYINTKWVFKSKATIGQFIKFPLVYLFQFTMSGFIIYVLIEYMFFYEQIAPLISIAITVPFMFILTKVILKEKTSLNKL